MFCNVSINIVTVCEDLRGLFENFAQKEPQGAPTTPDCLLGRRLNLASAIERHPEVLISN